jgi:hypothetical protein
MKDGHDFDDLAQEFQGIDAPGEALVRAVEKGRRRLVYGMIVGGLASVLLPAVGIFTVWKQRDAPSVVFAAMQIGIVVVVMPFALRSQRNAWNARSQTTRGFIELQIERCRDGIRRMRFMLRWLVPAIVAGLVLLQILSFQKNQGSLPIVFFWVPYVICAFGVRKALRKKAHYEREEARYLEERAALEAGGAP